MISPQDIFQDIQNLTTQLISISLSVQQNFPTISEPSNNINALFEETMTITEKKLLHIAIHS